MAWLDKLTGRTQESAFLIEISNLHIDRGNGKNSSDTTRELEAFIYECMDEYLRNGVSDDILNKLNEILKHVKIQCLVENMENKLVAVHVAYMPYNPHPLVFGAYMFSNVTSLGGLEGLNRCHSPDCQKFFIGRSNAKWCSKTCGSRSRVKRMRKKNTT